MIHEIFYLQKAVIKTVLVQCFPKAVKFGDAIEGKCGC